MKNPIIAYVAGYGSLVDAKSRRSTIGGTKGKVLVRSVRGFERTWLAHDRNDPNNKKFWITDGTGPQLAPVFRPCYLDLKVSVNAHTVCALIPVTVDQLKALDDRESGYDRVDVTNLTTNWKKPLPVYTYFGKAAYKVASLHEEAFIPFPYLDLCARAAKKLSKVMSMNFSNHAELWETRIFEHIKLGDGVVY